MTRTDASARARARAALAERQRRFEWKLARDEQARTASRLVAGKTHDLLNLVQIVQLATVELARRCDDSSTELIADLTRASADATRTLYALMELAQFDDAAFVGPPVEGVLRRVFAELTADLAGIVDLDVGIAVSPTIATSLDANALEHVAIGLVLDALTAPRIEIVVRERTIEGTPWIEIMCGAETQLAGDRFDLRAVEALASRAGGELTSGERRGGGTEVVVALKGV